MSLFKNTPIKRTFLAARTQDPELRKRLNATAEHSEYQPSYKWLVEGDNFSLTFKTKKDALAFIQHRKADPCPDCLSTDGTHSRPSCNE